MEKSNIYTDVDLGLMTYKDESKGNLKQGEDYLLTIRYDPRHSSYPTAWVKDIDSGSCIAVIPFVKEEWNDECRDVLDRVGKTSKSKDNMER